MKKLTTFLLMVLISTVGALAQTITTSGDVDFGTYSIKGKEYVEPDAGIGIDVTISDKFFDYEGDIMGEIVDDEAGVFYLEGSSYGIATVHIQPKYGNYTGTFTLNFYAIEKGTYTARAHFWGYGAPSYDQVDAYANLKLVVTDQAIIPELLTFEKVTSTSQLAAGDIVVFASESTPAVNADLSSTALPFYTDGVTFNSENNTIQTPKGITTFTLSKYSGNWQFTKTGTSKRLTMLVDNSGSKEVVAFGYDGDSDQGYYYTWNISFDSKGNATVARAGNTDYYVMINNMPSLGGDVFKPYNSNKNVYTLPQLYKQKSESAAESKITFSPSSIDFGSVELNETKSIEVTYTAEFLTEIPDFDISGTDKALFTVTADAANSLTSGKVTVTYAGKGTTTGAKSAGLYYLTQDINIELMDGTLPIAITLTGSTVHPTAIAIEQTSPQELEVGSTLQLSVAFTPTNTDAANKGITWTSNKPTIASVDENGLVKALTYDQYNNEVTITATSTDNEELQSTIVVKVIQVKPTSIVLDKDELIVGLGKTVELWATVKPDGASQSVKFWIDDTSIATRTNESKYENGAYKYYAKVTGKKLGETTIRAYSTADETVDKTIAVKVVDVVAESISFEQSEINVALGGTTTLAPTFTPSDVTDKSLTFSGYDATIVSVNAEGVVTALKEGTTTITATTSNGKSAQVTITVTGQIWYTLVTNPDLLLAGDQIIFARLNGETKYVINGWHSNKNSLTAETANAEFSADKVSCDNAMIFTISETTGGYKLTNNGATLGQNKTGKAELVTNKNDVWTISSDVPVL